MNKLILEVSLNKLKSCEEQTHPVANAINILQACIYKSVKQAYF